MVPILLISYVPGVLAPRLIAPVVVLANTIPAGVELKSPTDPGPKVGVTVTVSAQKVAEGYEKVKSGAGAALT